MKSTLQDLLASKDKILNKLRESKSQYLHEMEILFNSAKVNLKARKNDHVITLVNIWILLKEMPELFNKGQVST